MDINSINNQTQPITSATGKTGSTPTSVNGVDKQSFLNLLVTQLQNQDPLEPEKNSDFIAQLAQFQTLEGQNSMNDTLGSLVQIQQSQLALQGLAQAATLVGHNVSYVDPQTGAPGSGMVGSVTVDDGVMTAHIGDNKVPIGALTGILANPTSPTGSGTTSGTTSGSTSTNGGSTPANGKYTSAINQPTASLPPGTLDLAATSTTLTP